MRNDTAPSADGGWQFVWDVCGKPVVYYYIPFILSCYGLCTLLLKKLTNWQGLKLQKLAGSLSMYPAFFILIFYSHRAVVADDRYWGISPVSSTDDHSSSPSYFRWHVSSSDCDLFANWYIAANIVQAMGQIQTERAPLVYQLMAHHALSIACYLSGYYFNRFRWWIAFAGCCEMTNLFLVPVFCCKEFFPEWIFQTWYLYNSRLLWWTFVTHRLILFPVWLGLWYWDQQQYPAEAKDLHWFERYGYPITIFGLLVLSVIWFRAISRGLRKQAIAYHEARRGDKKRS